MVGKEVNVLFEKSGRIDGQMIGKSEYLHAVFASDTQYIEHWVMDDGFEGFMTPHRTRDGRPVCHRSDICGVIPTDQLFDTDEPWIPEAKKTELMNFFQTADAFGFLIYGHTDSRVVDVKGFGERQPRAQGHSAAALQQNRRVERPVCSGVAPPNTAVGPFREGSDIPDAL